MINGTVRLKINVRAESHTKLGAFIESVVKGIEDDRFVSGGSVGKSPLEPNFIEVETDMS